MRFFAACMGVVLLSACGGRAVPTAQNSGGQYAQYRGPSETLFSPAGRIKHVIVIVQENRTVDNLFNGLPGADTVTGGLDHTGKRIALKPVPFEELYDPDHTHQAWAADYDGGKMDGFDLPPTTPKGPADFNYSYVPQNETKPYFQLAERYTFADRNFSAESGPSYPGHQYLIAGQSQNAIGDPNDPFFRWDCQAARGTTTPTLDAQGHVVNGPFPCYDYQTLGDLLDAKGVNWRYYTELEEKYFGVGVQPYGAIKHVYYGKDWSKVVAPQVQIFADLALGKLAPVSWVNAMLPTSDHAQQSTNYGPDWVATIVNAVGLSSYWKDTAVFVTWDDWGGWYDHVAPPQLDRMGLSFRVPLVVVSPFAQHGYVSHVQHEPGSILHFIEETFGLGSLGTTDARADDLADCFDFSQAVKPYAVIPTRVGVGFFKSLKPDTKPIDY